MFCQALKKLTVILQILISSILIIAGALFFVGCWSIGSRMQYFNQEDSMGYWLEVITARHEQSIQVSAFCDNSIQLSVILQKTNTLTFHIIASIIQEHNVCFQFSCSMLHFVLNLQLLLKLWSVYSLTSFSPKKECDFLYKQLRVYSHMFMSESVHLFPMSST